MAVLLSVHVGAGRYPMDILVCSALGADMYDSVFPTRTARFGVALVAGDSLKLRTKEYANDFRCGASVLTPLLLSFPCSPTRRILGVARVRHVCTPIRMEPGFSTGTQQTSGFCCMC